MDVGSGSGYLTACMGHMVRYLPDSQVTWFGFLMLNVLSYVLMNFNGKVIGTIH